MLAGELFRNHSPLKDGSRIILNLLKMKKLFFLLTVLVLIFIVGCNKNSDLQLEKDLTNVDQKLEKTLVQSNIENSNIYNLESELTLPSCLDNTVVDSFIYFANEFTNYLMTDENLTNPLDSIQLAELISQQGINTIDEFYQFTSETWNIPLQVVINFSKYSQKVANELSRETPENHPIANRYYSLIKSGCLTSVLSNELFENDMFVISILRHGCGSFWSVFSSCGKAVIATVAACAAPSPVTIGLAILEIGDYVETLADC